jgi:nicotinamide riboside kinase
MSREPSTRIVINANSTLKKGGISIDGQQMKKLKVAIVGAPSTGKTVLAADVVNTLKKRGIVAMFVGEYARNWMAKHNRTPEVPTDQFPISLRQMRRETEFANSQDVLITDSSSWLGVIYASLLVRHGTDREESDLIHLMDLIEDTLPSHYDLQYYVPRVFPIQLEGGRWQTKEEEFDLIDRKIRGMIDLFNLPVKRLPDDPSLWIDIIVKDIDHVLKSEVEK